MLRNTVVVVCVLSLAAVATAAGPNVKMVYKGSPAAGLHRFTLHAWSDPADGAINAWSVFVDDNAHQVWPQVGPNPTDLDETLLASDMGSLFDPAWKDLDTHCLYGIDQLITGGIDGLTETNDGTNPAGLSLTPIVAGWDPKVGVGNFVQDGAALKPDYQTYSSSLVQLVVPEDEFAVISGGVAGPDLGTTEFNFRVPEPATLSVLALGGLALIRRRRR